MSFGPGELWLLAGLVLLIGEIVIPGVYLFWVGLAALGTGGFVLATDAIPRAAVFCFMGLTVASVLAGVALRRQREATAPAVVNLAGSGLVGRAAVVTVVEPAGLRVRVGDSDWSARADGAAPVVGETVRVRGVDGTTLLVG